MADPVSGPRKLERLSWLAPGERARVVFLSPGCRGPERRYLLELGVLPGTWIVAELLSPLGDPRAYRLREALVALRREQAEWVIVEPVAGIEGQA